VKRLLFLGLIVGIGLAIFAQAGRKAEADHGVVKCGNVGLQACILTSSPFVNNVIKTQGEVRYCIDNRGINYPGFRSQVASVMTRFAADLKVSGAREVSYSDPSCNVKNSMRDDHPCSGCGAWIYTSAYPLLIEYNAKQAYTRWDSTIGHEAGHGFCLIDEHYDKVNFRSWILNYGYWQHGAPTVMDGGTPFLAAYSPLGIWYLTDYDLDRCEETIGRDLDAPPPPVIYPYFDGATWIMCDPALPDVQCYWAYYVPGVQWFDKFWRPEWGPQVYLEDGSFEQQNWRLAKTYRGGFAWYEKQANGSYVCLSGCY
jgi:hypothetical protein